MARAFDVDPALRELLATRTIGGHITRSDPEDRFLAFLDAERLRRPRRNLTVEGYEVDFHWADARLVVELDGYATHAAHHAFANRTAPATVTCSSPATASCASRTVSCSRTRKRSRARFEVP
jgi:hypothetical protein